MTDKRRPHATYDDFLLSNRPFDNPIPLPVRLDPLLIRDKPLMAWLKMPKVLLPAGDGGIPGRSVDRRWFV